MAQSMNLKPFYMGFALLAIVGAAAIWWARSSSGPVDVGPVPVSTSGFNGYVLGSDSAKVEIIEYADFGCGACAHYAVVTGPDVKKRLVETGRVRVRFRDFPIPSHPQSPDAHVAAACAGEQGQFYPMHDQIFFGQRDWTRQRRPERRFRDYAEALRLDMDRYDSCVKERSVLGQIEAAKQEGIAVGVNSTPSFVVGGLLVVGALPYDSMVSLVERVEAAAAR